MARRNKSVKKKKYQSAKESSRLVEKRRYTKTKSFQSKIIKQPKTVKNIIVSPRRHPKQQGQAESVSGKRGILRVTTDLTRCRTRKKYKKKMLKAIAAQMKRSGKGLSSWRRRRRQSTNIIYRC